jgi:hypothetical protein
MNPADLGLHWKGHALELTARVININEGRNNEIARKCKMLEQYSVFVERLRKNRKMGMKLDKAVKMAVEYCLEHDILKEFLEQNSRRVINMIKTQWSFKDAMKWNRKEGFEEGIEKGREVRSVEVARNALMKGFSIDVIHDITGLDTDAIRNLRL